MIIDTTETKIDPKMACWNCGDIHVIPQGKTKLICSICGWREGTIECVGNSWKYFSLPNFNNISRRRK